MVQDLLAVEADQGDLGRPGEVQVVGGDRVRLLAVRGEHAGADQRPLADQRRDADQREVLADEHVEGVGVYRTLEQDQIGHQRVGAFAGHLAGSREVRPAALFQQFHMVQWREIEFRRRAYAPDDHVGGLIRPDRGARPRDGGGQQQQAVQPLRRLGELLAELLELDLELGVLGPQLGPPGVVGLGELLRRALPARLRLVQFVLEAAGGPVEVEQLVDVQVDALLPDGVPHRVRVLSYLSPVQHGCASVLVTEFVACQPATKTLPAVATLTPRSFWPADPGGDAGYGGYAATGESGGECC